MNSRLLPFLDNEINFNNTYKENFEKLNLLVVVGSPDDDLIRPWDSSHFNYYYDNNDGLVE